MEFLCPNTENCRSVIYATSHTNCNRGVGKKDCVRSCREGCTYSPVSPALYTNFVPCINSISQSSSKLEYTDSDKKLSIGNLVEAAGSLKSGELSSCANEGETDKASVNNQCLLAERKQKQAESSCSSTSDASLSCTMAKAVPYKDVLFSFSGVPAQALLSSNMFFERSSGEFKPMETQGQSEETLSRKKESSRRKHIIRTSERICCNCSTSYSPNWYLADDRRPLCNACGKFWKRTGTHRPSCHWGRRIKKRDQSDVHELGNVEGVSKKKGKQKKKLNDGALENAVLHASVTTENTKEEKSYRFASSRGSEALNMSSEHLLQCDSKCSNSCHNGLLHNFEENRPSVESFRIYENKPNFGMQHSLASTLFLDPAQYTSSLGERDVSMEYAFQQNNETSSVSCSTGIGHQYPGLMPVMEPCKLRNSTSRKAQLFALEEKHSKIFGQTPVSNSVGLMEVLAYAATRALKTYEFSS